MERPAPDGHDAPSPEDDGSAAVQAAPEDDGSAALEAALADPAFDELPAVQDPGRPEDPFHEPGAPHLALDEDQPDERGRDGAV